MPYNTFLKIDGLPGESKDPNHPYEIEIESFWFGGDTGGFGGSTGAGRVVSNLMNVTKPFDTASPGLFKASGSGRTFPQAALTFRKRINGSEVPVLVVNMTRVTVEHVANPVGGAYSPDGVPMEIVTLKFQDYKTVPPNISPSITWK
jgi:type VI secretion system secreted protein Hcp